MFINFGRAAISEDIIRDIQYFTTIWKHDKFQLIAVLKDGRDIELGTGSLDDTKSLLATIVNKLNTYDAVYTGDLKQLEEKVAVLEREMNELYNAPGNPGYVKAQIDFDQLVQ